MTSATVTKSPPRSSLFYSFNLSALDRPSFMLELMQDYGDIVKVPSLVKTYLINNPAYLEHIFQKNPLNYVKGGMTLKPLYRLLGNGLLMLEGQVWQKRRKLLAHLFQPRATAKYNDLIVSTTLETMRGWEVSLKNKQPLNIHSEMMKIVLRISAKALFSYKPTPKEIVDIISAIAIENKYACTWLAFFPNLPTVGHFRAKKANKILSNFIKSMIQMRQQNMAGYDDLLSLLLQPEHNLTEKEIFDEAKTFLLTGHETTGNALSWTFYLLCRNIAAYQQMEQEIEQTLGNNLFKIEDLSRLAYTHMIFQESLRLYPPIWTTGRKTLADDRIDEYHIPAGSEILICPYTMHRNQGYWQKPDLFIPERFRPEEIAKRPRYSYIPFGGGPHTCIAGHFATQLAITILSTITQHYRFRLVNNDPVEFNPYVSLNPKHGIWVSLQKK